MTALDALLPGPRQRPDPAPRVSNSETPARETPGNGFGQELGRLERPQMRGEPTARTAADDEAPAEVSPVEEAGEPASPVSILDPQAALRALIVAAQDPATPAAQMQGSAAAPGSTPAAVTAPATGRAAAAPGQTDLVALAERAAGSAWPGAAVAAPPAERPKVAVVGQETHFAPVMPDRAGPAAQAPAVPPTVIPKMPSPPVTAPTPQMEMPALQAAAPAVQAADPAGSPQPVSATVQAAPVALAQAAPTQAPAAATGTRPTQTAPSGARADAAVEAASPETDGSRRPALAVPQGAQGTDRQDREDSSRREPGTAPQESVSTGAAASQPGLPAPTLRRLADAIAAEAPAAPAEATGAPARLGQAQDGPLRQLTIQLQPNDLGTVTVRMRLQEGRLEVGMETGRHETAELLRRDGGALTDMLRGSGYQADLVAIRAGGAELSGGQQGAGQGGGQSPQPGAGQGASAQNQPQGQPQRGQAHLTDGGQGGGSNPGSGGRGNTPQAEPARSREGRHEAVSIERDRGGLYL